jgi:hypothetical protein
MRPPIERFRLARPPAADLEQAEQTGQARGPALAAAGAGGDPPGRTAIGCGLEKIAHDHEHD